MFSLVWALLKGGAHALTRESLFLLVFVAMNDYKHTTFQLLAVKGDDEVEITTLYTSIEYGWHNSLPSYLEVLRSLEVNLTKPSNIWLNSWMVSESFLLISWNWVRNNLPSFLDSHRLMNASWNCVLWL